MKDVTALIVNYATPDLTRRAVWSLRSLYPELPLCVVENGSPDDSADRLRALASDVQPFELLETGHNLHHGPGLDHGLRAVPSAWVLLFDSDCLAYRHGFLEAMGTLAQQENAYMVGQTCYVDSDGFNVSLTAPDAHRYVHPKCALVQRDIYLTLPPFARHGAPCLANQVAAAERGLPLVDFPVDDYVYHLGRGTVDRHGYHLGLPGWLGRLRHHVRRLL